MPNGPWPQPQDRTDMDGETTQHGPQSADGVVVRRSERGWLVGDEESADLTSAMVLADLLAADLGSPAPTLPARAASGPVSEEDEAARLAVTVAQLEHALAARVRVEQAIGVLAERHRLPPRQAFDLLRNVARSRGDKVLDLAETVVASASNPLLPLPEELARRQPPPRQRGRSPRHARTDENVGVPR
jgi:ANTAR domain